MDQADADADAYAGLSPRSRRKRKNRDQMRAARQREKETMERLHAMVARLEAQYQALQQQQQHAAPPQDTAAYAEVVALKAQFQEENFLLKQTLVEKNKLKETLERHVGDFVEPTPEELRVLKEDFPEPGEAPRPPPPPASPVPAPASAYAPLSESAVWAIMGNVHRAMTAIQHKLLHQNRQTTATTISVLSTKTAASPSGVATPPPSSDDEYRGSNTSSPLSPPSSPTPLPPFCGWNVRHLCEHHYMRFLFEKAFPHISPFEAMNRMWKNELAMHSYRDTPSSGQQSMHVVQQLNDDTYIFQRRLQDATTSNREVVSTYLRYRMRTTNGFLIGLATVEDFGGPSADDEHNRVWATHVCVWTEFVPIVSNAGCSVRITGSTNMDNPTNAQRNVADVIIGLLRWENLNIGPVFALADR